MRKRRIAAAITGLLVPLAVAAAGSPTPHRFAPESLDRGLVQVSDAVTGTTWAAWSYRNGAEYDIAVSSADSDGVWSEPLLFGRDDRGDQHQPAIAVDSMGTVYLAFVDSASGSVKLATRPAGLEAWSPAFPVGSSGGRVSLPALRIVASRLVVAWRACGVTEIVDLPLFDGGNSTQGLIDNPDPVENSTDPPNDRRERRSWQPTGIFVGEGDLPIASDIAVLPAPRNRPNLPKQP